MKQQITEEQWKEIGDESPISNKQEKFVDTVTQIGLTLPTIGQMIEFLGEDWYEDLFDVEEKAGCNNPVCPERMMTYISKEYTGELADALWKEVKKKL